MAIWPVIGGGSTVATAAAKLCCAFTTTPLPSCTSSVSVSGCGKYGPGNLNRKNRVPTGRVSTVTVITPLLPFAGFVTALQLPLTTFELLSRIKYCGGSYHVRTSLGGEPACRTGRRSGGLTRTFGV